MGSQHCVTEASAALAVRHRRSQQRPARFNNSNQAQSVGKLQPSWQLKHTLLSTHPILQHDALIRRWRRFRGHKWVPICTFAARVHLPILQNPPHLLQEVLEQQGSRTPLLRKRKKALQS